MGLFSRLFGKGNNDQSSVIGHILTVVGGFFLVLPTMQGGPELIQSLIGSLNPKMQALASLFLIYIGAAKAAQLPAGK